jgi:uncharacterized protein (TIGR02246 family)
LLNDAQARKEIQTKKVMTTEETITKNEAAIRALVDKLVKGLRTKDINSVVSVYTPDLVAFDIVPPLQYVGAESYRKRWQEVFESFETIEYEVRDLSITAGEDVAFSHSFNKLTGTMKNGRTTNVWVRWTPCYRKANGKWLIAHLQASVPIDFETGKAVLDLAP